MWEIRFWGRGGQGAVVAAELLAQAAFLDGKVPQSFPFFGVERRAAPVTAYARISDAPIGVRTSIAEPGVVVVLERGLLRAVPATDGLRPGGWLLVNAPPGWSGLVAPPGARVATIDANRIAVEHHLGSTTMPIVNTSVLGALARVTGVVTLGSLDRVIGEFVPSRAQENRAACRAGYDAVEFPSGPIAPPRPSEPVGVSPLPDGPVASISTEVLRTSSWRTLKPEIDRGECTRCNFCWKFCPDTAIDLDAQGFPVVVEAHCKGCGICAQVCPPRAIAMVAEA